MDASATLLVVDDEETIRYTFGEFLAGEGYTVKTAANYEQALRILATEQVDCAFVDILLGEKSGIDLLREIKALGLTCPVVVMTGRPDLETAAASVRADAFDYLWKPVTKETLLHATRLALQHKSLLEDRGRIEEEKERYRHHLEAIFKSVGDGIVTVDTDLKVLSANDAIRRTCGVAVPGMLDRSIREIPNPCHQTCHTAVLETLRSHKPVREYRMECGHKITPSQVVVVNSSPLIDQDNRFIGAVMVIRDITRLTDLENELLERNRFQSLIGKSQRMQEIFRLLQDLAEIDTTVLITGESGTGKELVANALHHAGPRRSQPLVKVNCSALTESLLESELFGHVRGAFTGAAKDRIGRFQMAHRGTVLLDEIGDVSPRIQLKLIRVLQEKEIERVGESKPMKVDVRVIAATNTNLREKVRRGEFREDLYYRLKVVEIHLPALRERRDDIPLLVSAFLERFNERFHKRVESVSDDVMRIFMEYGWPGNIRELEHALEHAFVLCSGPTLQAEYLPAELRGGQVPGPVPATRKSKESEDVRGALAKAGWNKAKAARMLGMSRQHLYRKIREFGIEESP